MLEKYRIGIDIGGTFTDFALVDDETGVVLVEKCLTTPGRPEEAVLQGLGSLQKRIPDAMHRASAIVHATTLFTNTVLERSGAKVGLLTTKGFRDILEIGREAKYDVYDPLIDFPTPLISRALRLAVSERVLSNGTVLHPLDIAGVRKAAQEFRLAGVQAVAVVFIHSYANDSHERLARNILQEELPGIDISISCEVLPEPREYERSSTTALNAYVQPIATNYLDTLAGELAGRGYRHPPYIMQSNGGSASFELTKRFPVLAIESGPAAGAQAAAYYGNSNQLSDVLSFDMGGTTAKLCVIQDGKPSRTRSFEVDRMQRFKPGSGIPISTPVLDLLEIGSGGGSIAQVDSLGLLRVGPRSASSVPGPACYGRGGKLPTVTDANLVLGYLDPHAFLGGAMTLDANAARAAISEHVAVPLGINVIDAAWGIHDLVNETMAAAARVHIAEKGVSSDKLVMIAFGGAGPIQAVELARKIGCREVVVPPLPGVMSAFGLLVAPVSIERSRTIQSSLKETDASVLEAQIQALQNQARDLIPQGASVQFERTAEIRNHGQDYAIDIPLPDDCTAHDLHSTVAASYAERYRSLFGHIQEELSLEFASIRVTAIRPSPPPRIKALKREGGLVPRQIRSVYLPAQRKHVNVPIYDRGDMAEGDCFIGPAIVMENESATVIGEGDDVAVNAGGCLRVTLAQNTKNEMVLQEQEK